MHINNISDLEKYTIAIYSEHQSELKIFGSGILIKFKDANLLVSAHHVLDREDEKLKIQDDIFEKGISYDDTESFYAKGKDEVFFYINNYYKGLVSTAKVNSEKNDVEFNDDTEFGICKLDKQKVHCFLEAGKRFYEISGNNALPLIKSGKNVIFGGFPKYAQKENEEIFRSYLGKFPLNNIYSQNGLIRILFENDHVFCIEMNDFITINKPQGIAGMSGCGVWLEENGKFFPVGIILRQEESFIEIYPFYSILTQIS